MIMGYVSPARAALLGQEFSISTGTSSTDPSVAYDSVNQRFLVAWGDYRSGTNYDIYGQLVSSAGTLLGGNIPISTVGSNQWYPSIAYDPVNQRFLVAWKEDSICRIYGQLVSASGSLVGANFTISTGCSNRKPSVAYDPINQRFLVAWLVWTSSQNYGQLVSASGSLVGANFTISTLTVYQTKPSVAYDPINQRFLVAWGDWYDGTNMGIYSQLISASGSLVGEEIPIPVSYGDLSEPSVAYDSVNQRFLVAWQDYRSGTNYDIYGQLLNANGNGSLIGGNFTISTAPNDQMWTSVAYDSANQRFLVAWEDFRSGTNWDIYGQLLNANGSLIGGNFTISTAPNDQGGTSMAYDSINQRFLVAWDDLRSGTSGDIYGRLVSPIRITTSSLASGFSYVPYTALLQATEGTFPYIWAITSGALPPGLNLNSNTGEIYSIPLSPGVYSFSVQVTDANGHVVTTILAITINPNQPPTVTLTVDPTIGMTPLMVSFTATASDPDGSIAQYRWDFNGDSTIDLTTITGATIFTYTTPGAYLAQVTAVDNLGATALAYAVISVSSPPPPGNQPPVVNLVASPTSGPPPLTVSFTATASDPDGSITEYRWDFTGDGAVDITTTTGSSSYTYTVPGVFLAQVSVVDDKGATAFASSIIVVEVVEPFTVTERELGKWGCGCTQALVSPSQGFSNLLLALLPLLYVLWRKKRATITYNPHPVPLPVREREIPPHLNPLLGREKGIPPHLNPLLGREKGIPPHLNPLPKGERRYSNCQGRGKSMAQLYRAISISLALFVVIGGARFLGAFDLIERKEVDIRFLARKDIFHKEPFPSDKIVIVAIDQDSIERLNKWPWPRKTLAQAIDRLKSAGAKTIGIDLILSESDPYSPENDSILADSIKRAGNVVLPLEIVEGPWGDVKIAYPIKEIKEASSAQGAINVDLDPDGFLRSIRLSSSIENERIPSFPLALIDLIGGHSTSDPDTKAPASIEGDIWINYTSARFQSIPFYTLLAPDFSPDIFKEKIALIGKTFIDSKDTVLTPLGQMYGIEVYANVLNMMILNRYLFPIHEYGNYLLLFFLVALTTGILMNIKPLWGSIITLIEICALVLCALMVFTYSGAIFDLACPGVGIALSWVGINFYRLMKEEQEKVIARAGLERHLSPSVAEEVLRNPGILDQGTKLTTITVLFSDIRNFTEISEKLPPIELIDLLNEYLKEMSEIILSHGGTLNKFIGDGILAFWGAPIPQADHAQRAVSAALHMKKRLDGLKFRLVARDRDLWMGVGIHTGNAIVGNVGSPRRMEYTAIGDTVNLASRIEGVQERNTHQ